MKTILHFSCEALVLKVPNFIIGTAHLITYSIPCMDGEYREMVRVYKNRAGNHGNLITHEQLSILQDCVLNDKPQPVFMKSNAQKGNDIARDILYDRLCKLEKEVFPSGYFDCPGLESFLSVPFSQRLLRMEKKLGVIKSPSCDIGRLENCENLLKSIKEELNILDEKVFSTREDIHKMKSVTTLDGQFKRLEEKLHISTPYDILTERVERIKIAWRCHELPYIPKYKAGETVEVKHILLENSPRFVEIWLEQTIAEVKPLNDPITLTIRFTYIFENGGNLFCDWADKSGCVRKVTQPVAWEG